MLPDFQKVPDLGIVYQPAMLKTNIVTMPDITNFVKVDATGNSDNGEYAATNALKIKKENIEKINNLNNQLFTTLPIIYTTKSVFTNTNTNILRNTLPPNPDDSKQPISYFCGLTYTTINCNKPCPSGLDIECGTETCFYTNEYCKLP